MPSEVPMGWPNCNTNCPAGMSPVAKRWPAVTAASTVTVRPFGSSSSRPGDVSFLTTATLSLGSTMTAYSLIGEPCRFTVDIEMVNTTFESTGAHLTTQVRGKQEDSH